VNQVLEVK
jgi:hypothetical protein